MDYMAEAARYEAKADELYWEHMDTGDPRALRLCERNRERAEAYRLAASAKRYRCALDNLKYCVQSINSDASPERVVKNVRHIQQRIKEGRFDA